MTASAFLLLATIDAGRWLPREERIPDAAGKEAGFAALLSRHDLLRIFSVAAGVLEARSERIPV